MKKRKNMPMIATLLLRTRLIAIALTFFFSMMAGMYYKSEPRGIRMAIADEDNSPLSRALVNSFLSTDVFSVQNQAVDYEELQRFIDEGKADVGILIPHDAYKDVLNRRTVNILTVLNGSANPIIPKLALGNVNRIVMTLATQLQMHVPVEDLGSIPNTRHARTPLLMVSSRVFYSPTMNMGCSMLPAFMGLAMQIVSIVIVLLALRTNLRHLQTVNPNFRFSRQMPVKGILLPAITSWLMVGTAISLAFYTVMKIFHIPLPSNYWNVVWVIFVFVLAMESISIFFTLNINNTIALLIIFTLIVLPAFMYSGFMVPLEQLAHFPKMVGGWFPLRYYLQALYGTFNRNLSLSQVGQYLNSLWYFVAAFMGLSLISVLIGSYERKGLAVNSTEINSEGLQKEVRS